MSVIVLSLKRKHSKCIGDVFNGIRILDIVDYFMTTSGYASPIALVKCHCGKEFTIRLLNLRCKCRPTKSCGCIVKEAVRNAHIIHGKNNSKEYFAFYHAKSRCNDRNNSDYEWYGARGIEFRFENFQEFYNEIGDAPNSKYSLDRKDNNGHYEVGNIRWATSKEQSSNKRRARQSNHKRGRIVHFLIQNKRNN